MRFPEYLEKAGIPAGRRIPLGDGFYVLHKALSRLDKDNLATIKLLGLDKLMNAFSICEDMKNYHF